MYRIQLDPGPWAQYVKRADNIGLSLYEVTKKYQMESNLYATQLFEASQAQQQSLQSTAVAAVGSGGASAPPASPVSSNCIEFVNNTTDGTYSEFTITTSGPTNFTINWGDGTTFTDVVDGSYTVDYSYADSDQSYNCTLCFDDISLVTELDFLGDD